MDWESNNSYLHLCRLCLSEPGISTIHEIDNLPRDIFVCTGIEMIITDNLPKKICNNCYKIIKNTIDFRELASKNDLHLKSVCGNSEKETINEDLVSSTISNVDEKSKYFDQEEQHRQKQLQEIINPNNQSDEPVKLSAISIRKDLFATSTQPTYEDKLDTKDCTKNKQKKINPIEVLEFRCDVCCRNFESWKKLYLHSRLHNKILECPMEFCSKKFATKGDLDKHVRTHTGEKPYECNICKRKFTQNVTLKNHIEIVHREDS